MIQRSPRDRPSPTLVAVGISVVVHLALLVAFLPPIFPTHQPKTPDEDAQFEVTTTVEKRSKPRLKKAPQKPSPADPKPAPSVQKSPKKSQKEPDEPQTKPDEITHEIDRKVVQQQTNDKTPDKADYLSKQANQVDEQTRARETTTKNVLPGRDVPDKLRETTGANDTSANPDKKLASRVEKTQKPNRKRPTRKPPSEPLPQQKAAPPEHTDPTKRQKKNKKNKQKTTKSPAESTKSPVIRDKARPESAGKPTARQLFQPSAKDYNKVFGQGDQQRKGRLDDHKRGRRLLAGWKQHEKAMRASLENNIIEVRPGNHTGVNANASVYASYIGRIHRKIHARWGASFLPRLDNQYPAGHPLNDPSLKAVLEYVIDAHTGHVDAVNIVESSGEMMFDAEAVSISHMVGPHPKPPAEIVSPDGKIYIHWSFWRDQRQCGPFGASVYIVN